METASHAGRRTSLTGTVRRASLGACAGFASSCALSAGVRAASPWLALLGALIGAAAALAEPYGARRPTLDEVLTWAVLGIPLWTLVDVIALPVLASGMPAWTPAGMRGAFPALVGWVLYGASLALFIRVLESAVERVMGPFAGVTPADGEPAARRTRIVILGGGFAGVTTAQELERRFGADPTVEFSLVSATNALLFTPMLAEVAGSSLEPTHISSPLRTSLRRTQIVRGTVRGIDLNERSVELDEADSGAAEPARKLAYDHLVLALGSSSNYFGRHDVEREAFEFKSLLDAIRIRNHVIEMLERADREPAREKRNALLTFVVAGGGFAGVELAGALNDFARGIAVDYPRLQRDEIRVVLVHPRERILPELSASLAAYALERMSARGVGFRLNTRVAGARPGVVVLQPNEELATRTLVWTAGTAPNALLATLPVARDRRGAVLVDETLAVPGEAGLWAAGDCAAVPDARTGRPCPPTAQFALREAQTLARNIRAAVKGRPRRAFRFDSLGALCVIGHQSACAELAIPFLAGKNVRFSGLLAWAVWRTIYLAKLPGFERKVRVLSDWTLELFFPRDTVQTLELA
jgi:NADH dehydrogenase